MFLMKTKPQLKKRKETKEKIKKIKRGRKNK